MYRNTLGGPTPASVRIRRCFPEHLMEKTWLKQYPAGVPANIDVEQYGSLVGLLDESFKKYGSRMAYKFMGKAISFAAVDEASRALAAYLQAQGLEKGDRVAVMMPNVPQYPVAV